jgi:hypothetical protein
VTVRHRSQNLSGEFFGKHYGALRLAARTEIPYPATERQKMLFPAFRAANAREAFFKPSTRQEFFDRAYDHGA